MFKYRLKNINVCEVPVTLEPIISVEPNVYLTAYTYVSEDGNQRKGYVLEIDTKGTFQIINGRYFDVNDEGDECQVPLNEDQLRELVEHPMIKSLDLWYTFHKKIEE